MELPEPERAKFLMAILERQFTGKEPENLTGMAKLAYISQRHSIDAQVKGWEDKTGEKLHPIVGGGIGGSIGPGVQEKEKEKEKEKVQDVSNQNSKKPNYEEFLQHAQSRARNSGYVIDPRKVRAKYDAWVDAGWRTGGDKPREIKNWKSTLTNTLRYLTRDDVDHDPTRPPKQPRINILKHEK